MGNMMIIQCHTCDKSIVYGFVPALFKLSPECDSCTHKNIKKKKLKYNNMFVEKI